MLRESQRKWVKPVSDSFGAVASMLLPRITQRIAILHSMYVLHMHVLH